jgi:hypothetical protein
MVARKSSPSNRMNHSEEENDRSGEEIVDYAATADEFFAAHNSSDEEIDDASGGKGNEESDDSTVDGAIEDGQSHQESHDDDESVEEYPEDSSHASEVEEEQNEDLLRQKRANAGNAVVIPGTDEPCSFDLRNLLALSSYPVDSHQLYTPITSSKEIRCPKNEIIPRDQSTFLVNEEFLLQKATIGCTQLISALWKLPIERSDAGPMVTLPLHDESKVPRSLVS